MEKRIEVAVRAYIESLKGFRRADSLASRINSDLWNGPTYYLNGEQASMFDEGAKPFDFSGACSKLYAWTSENIGTLYMDSDSECVSTSEPQGFFEDEEDEDTYVEPGEYYELEPKEVIEALWGREIIHYVY